MIRRRFADSIMRSERLSIFAAVWIALFALLAPRVPAQTRPSNPTGADGLAAERAKMEASVSGLPRENLPSLSSLVRFVIRDQALIAYPNAQVKASYARLDVPETTGPITILFYAAAPGLQADPPNFRILHHDLSPKDLAQSITTIAMTGGRLTVTRDVESDDAQSSVQLIAAPPAAAPDSDDPAVVLYLSRFNKRTNQSELNLRRAANTFRELCTKYPDETNRYLRPIFADYGQDVDVFSPGSRAAWQVMSEYFRPDDAQRKQVAELLAKLDAEEFQDRLAAQNQLKKLGQPAALVLMRIDRSTLSPQVRSSVDAILEPFVPLTAEEAGKSRDDVNFLLDALASEDPQLRGLVWNRLRELTQTTIDFDPNADATTRSQSLVKLRRALQK